MDEIQQLKDRISQLEQTVGFFSLDIKDLEGFIETVTTIPSGTPSKGFWRQFKIYVDDISSPSTQRLYMYSTKTNTWLYATLT